MTEPLLIVRVPCRTTYMHPPRSPFLNNTWPVSRRTVRGSSLNMATRSWLVSSAVLPLLGSGNGRMTTILSFGVRGRRWRLHQYGCIADWRHRWHWVLEFGGEPVFSARAKRRLVLARCSGLASAAPGLCHQMLDLLARHLISLHHLLGHLTAKDIREGG